MLRLAPITIAAAGLLLSGTAEDVVSIVLPGGAMICR